MAARRSRSNAGRAGETARGTAVTRRNSGASTGGGEPAAATGNTREQLTTQTRLAAQRQAGAGRKKAEPLTGEHGTYTVVVRNGMPRRRNGIVFDDQPRAVDTEAQGWDDEQLAEFFNDKFLMITEGQSRGAELVEAEPADEDETGEVIGGNDEDDE